MRHSSEQLEGKVDELKNKVRLAIEDSNKWGLYLFHFYQKINQKDEVLHKAASELERIKLVLQTKNKEV